MAAKHILVGADFSEQSKRAVMAAAEYARANGSKVTLIYVTDPRAFIPPQAILTSAGPGASEETYKAELDALRDELFSDLEVSTVVVANHATARTLCDYATEHDVDLVAVGSHGLGGAKRWLIGSVAERVVRHAHCNVLVVRQ